MEIIFEIIFRVAAFALFAVFALWLPGAYNKLRYKGYGRQLSDAELDKVYDIVGPIERDAVHTEYPTRYWLFQHGIFPMIISAVICVGLYWLCFQHLRADVLVRIPETAEHVLARTDFSFSGVIALFVAIMLVPLGCMIAGQRSRKFRIFLVHKAGWGQLMPEERAAEDFFLDVLDMYYKGKLDINDPGISADVITDKIFKAPNRKIALTGAVFIALFAVFFRFDLYHYEWIEGETFVKNKYLSTQEVRFNVSGIQSVERQCRITGGGESNGSAHFEYYVIGPQDIRFELGHEPWEQFAALIDEIETNPNISRPPVKIIKAISVHGEPENMQTCVKYLKHEYDVATAQRLSNIFETEL